MEDYWSMVCSENGGNIFSYGFKFSKYLSSCTNHLFLILFGLFMLMMLSFIIFRKSSSRSFRSLVRYSNLQLVSAITNGSLGLLHLCLGIWVLEENLRKNHNAFPLNRLLLELFQGVTWLFVSPTISLQIKQISRVWLWLFSILMFFVSSILCVLSMSYAIRSRELSLAETLDVISFPGAILMMLCTYKASKCEDTVRDTTESLYASLNFQFNDVVPNNNVTLFAEAGLFSKISFWWLNPLMKKGQDRILQDEDIPKLREFE